jgi:hypothetical protein
MAWWRFNGTEPSFGLAAHCDKLAGLIVAQRLDTRVSVWRPQSDSELRKKLAATWWIAARWSLFCLAWFVVAASEILPFWIVALAPWPVFAYTLVVAFRVWRKEPDQY